MEVVGRDTELQAIAQWLEGAPEDVQVIEGAPGLGKTTLWQAALAEADRRGFLTLRCSPAQSEAQLSFAGLRDLLDRSFDEIADELPEPQRHALAVTLLREPPRAEPPDRGTVAATLLSTLRALGTRRPTLVAVDDLQWLDGASYDPLRYAIRRLEPGTVRFLLARRPDDDALSQLVLDPDRARVLAVGPLSVGALGRIVHTRLGIAYPRPTLRRIQEVSDGNPFFALQLARSLGPSPPSASDAPFPAPSSLHELVDARLLELSPGAFDVLSIAAIASRPTIELLAAALGEDPSASLDTASAAHIVTREGSRVTFAHPLYAAAVYDLTPAERRVAIHRLLAEIVEEPDERAGHLAAATTEPDPAIADVLEKAAQDAARRGAPAMAAELLEHALRITPVESGFDRGRRSLEAGWYWFVAGDGDRARELLESALAAAPRGHDRGSALIRLGRFESQSGDRRTAIDLYREALEEVGPGDPALGAEIHEALGWAIHLTRGDALVAQRHAQTAIGLAETVGDDEVLSSALVVLAQSTFFSGGGLAEETIERAFAVHAGSPSVRVLARPDHHWAFLLLCADQLDEARSIMLEMRELARARGDETALPWILMRLSQVELYAGNWDLADALVEEGLDIALHAAQRPIHADLLCTMALFAAHRGDAERAHSLADSGVAAALSAGTGIGSPIADSALGMLDLSLGDAAACARRLEPLLEASENAHVVDPGVNRYVPDLVAAHIELGRLDDARANLERLEERALQLDRPSVLAVAKRCRGLLLAAQGDVEDALTVFDEALGLHARATIPFEHARTYLAAGVVRRRARRRRAARESLEQALEIFDALGAELWAARSSAELARIGGRAPSPGGLTPTEQRVAALVADGKANKEVAAELVVSVHTVESTLTSVYRKLEIRSRTELARRLAEESKP
jgi:tetratricopeptide (TPR) repeat protein